MNILVYLEAASVRGGIEIFAERHVAQLREAGHAVAIASDLHGIDFNRYDAIVVHKCDDVATLEKFPPEKTTFFVHDHEPICPRGYAYTPLGRNCTRPGGLWPCILCAPLCRSWKRAVRRVVDQSRRRRAMARFAKTVVISNFMKSRLVANGLDPARIEVRNVEIPDQPTLDDGEGPSGTIDLLYLGQLIRGKGVHLLLKAMAKMERRRTLDIVGTGNMEAKLKTLAHKLGLDGRVFFRGFRHNPQEWMAKAECVVVPSFWQEPYGLVAAEAASLGRKVVAFAVGGLPEACAGRATLVEAGNIDALAAALDKV